MLAVPSVHAVAQQPQSSQPDSAAASESSEGQQDLSERDGESLPMLEEMELPTARQLLTESPADWIILKTDEVIVSQPVSPRPDTLAKMQEAIEASFDWPRPSTEAEIEEQRERRNALYYLEVYLPGDPEPYKLHMKHVAEIRHHEDLMLRRVDILLSEGDLSTAFELMFRLARREPEWPGLQERENRMLFVQAEEKFKDGRAESALVFVEELNERVPGYSGLHALAGKVVDHLVSEAVEDEEFRKARHFLNRLRSIVANHPVTDRWSNTLLETSERLIAQANQASTNGEHAVAADLVDKAARAWPRTSGLREAHRRFTRRFQQLKVGVLHLSGEPSSYFLATVADRRRQLLTQAWLFEIDRIDDTPHYRTRFFEQWEPTDLGRRTEFTLRQHRSYWESLPVVTASSVISTLQARLNPASPAYNERFDSLVHSLTVQSPFRFEVRFNRIPLRTETLFRFPVRAADRVDSDDTTDGAVLSQRFRLHEQDDDRAVYRRAHPQQERAPQYHVAEVIERKYDSYDRAIQGLLRGEISFLPHLPIPEVEQLRGDDRFFVQRSSVPVSHVLQFNPRSEPLQNRELRRALAYAIDRPRLLKEVILDGSESGGARLVSAPFPRDSYAYGSLIDLREHDVLVAVALTLGAKRQLGGELPRLRVIAPPEPVARAAARQIIRQWERIGVTAELVSQQAASGGVSGSNWDIVYRTVQMDEPLTQLWPFLTFDPQVRVESLRHLPDWLAQELIQLENAGDWNSATRILHQLHRHLQSEAQVIPLWEVDDLAVIRRNISGFPRQPVHPYQGIERWTVQSWYPTDRP